MSEALSAPKEMPPVVLRKILVSLALMESSITVAYARALAKPRETELRLMHVVEVHRSEINPGIFGSLASGHSSDERPKLALARLDLFCEEFSRNGFSCGATVRVGVAHEQILSEVEVYRPDLLIIGNRATSVISRFLLGNTAEQVLRRTSCPVLVAKRQMLST